MINTANVPAWKTYDIGTEITRADGTVWNITNIDVSVTEKGSRSRTFTLRSASGEVVTKSSRGLTLWSNGISEATGGTGYSFAGHSDSLAQVIAAAVSQHLDVQADAPGVDRDEVISIVDDRIKHATVKTIEVVTQGRPAVDVGVQHVHFEALLRIVSARVNAWLVGPAGSGKTSAAHAVATALGLPFYAKSVGPQTSESSLLGYQDANGRTVRTQLREAFEHGGVYLLDEVDAANPGVLTVINSLTANGSASFPDAVVAKHKDFVLLAGANTIGQGADRQYVGRQQIDAATLDRFAFLNWDYDPTIEARAAGVPVHAVSEAPVPTARVFDEGADYTEERCISYVQNVVRVRNAVSKFGKAIRFIVSPRASIHGTALIRAGFSVVDAAELCLWKGLDSDTRAKIECIV
jgi:MoxR-like ATPase